jgi:hypothetical protein
MKNHSDNIEVLSGLIPIYGFNVFDKNECNQYPSFISEFKSTINTIIKTLEKYDIVNWETDNFYGDDIYCLFTLSIPNFKKENNVYTLHSGLFVWDGRWFKQGCQFKFNNGDIIILTPELIQYVNITPIDINVINFDIYASIPLTLEEATDRSTLHGELNNLDVAMAELNLDVTELDNVDEDDFKTIKYDAIYAPELNSFNNFLETIGYSLTLQSIEEDKNILEIDYDNFTIIFKNTNSLYAYTLVECNIFTQNSKGDDGVEIYKDPFGEMFNYENKQGLINIGLENILPNLKEIVNEKS